MTDLRTKMKQEMILRGFSLGTQAQYIRAVIKLNKHYSRSPAKLSLEEVKQFLLFVISNQSYAASTYNVMLYGLKFFYAAVLNKDILAISLPRHKEPQKLPDILSQAEVTQIIKATANLKYRTMLIITYGAGLRASEVVALNIEDIDSKRMVIHVRQGKRSKDRYAILSPFMLSSLRIYWKQCRLSNAKNSINCTRLFVNKSETNLSVANLGAIYKYSKFLAGITKCGGIHALRHAFATHSLELGTDLYTIKELLGHSSIKSTVRYLRMTSKTLQATKSPVDQLNL